MLSKMLPTILYKKKILFNVVSVFLGQHCTGKKPMQCCPRGSRQHCIVNILCNVDLILLGQRSTGKRYAMLSQRLQTTSYRKIRQFRQCLNNIWSLCLHMYVSGPSLQKNIKLSFLGYGNWLELRLKQQLGILTSNRLNFLSDSV